MHATSQIVEALPLDEFGVDLITEIKNLRAFAICLSGSMLAADDLVEATLLRAWSKSSRLRVGKNRQIDLLTILRKIFYSSFRKRALEVQDGDCVDTARPGVSGHEEGHIDLQDFRKALTQLPVIQNEVIILIGASGYTYEEAAAICQVEIGTVKTRMDRAQMKLIELLDL
jgi:RNA polymerase sigma-70 factor (ECF subfamily)